MNESNTVSLLRKSDTLWSKQGHDSQLSFVIAGSNHLARLHFVCTSTKGPADNGATLENKGVDIT